MNGIQYCCFSTSHSPRAMNLNELRKPLLASKKQQGQANESTACSYIPASSIK